MSNGTDTSNGVKAYQVENKSKFYEKWEHVLKTYINKDGKEHSYWTIENVTKKESKGIKRLVKKVFYKS